MSSAWYFAKDQGEEGPISLETLRHLAQSRYISPDDLVWKDGMPDWVPASSIPELSWGSLPACEPAHARAFSPSLGSMARRFAFDTPEGPVAPGAAIPVQQAGLAPRGAGIGQNGEGNSRMRPQRIAEEAEEGSGPEFDEEVGEDEDSDETAVESETEEGEDGEVEDYESEEEDFEEEDDGEEVDCEDENGEEGEIDEAEEFDVAEDGWME